MARILALDDDPDILEVYRELLEDRYEVLSSISPIEALKAMEANPGWFDLAIIDLNLPGMSGLEFFHQLRAQEIYTPVILCSGFLSNFASAALFDSVIEKSAVLERLRPAVERLLFQKQQGVNRGVQQKMLRNGIDALERYLQKQIHPNALNMTPDSAPKQIVNNDDLMLWFAWYQIRSACRSNG